MPASTGDKLADTNGGGFNHGHGLGDEHTVQYAYQICTYSAERKRAPKRDAINVKYTSGAMLKRRRRGCAVLTGPWGMALFRPVLSS
jgi:hypothetical protein